MCRHCYSLPSTTASLLKSTEKDGCLLSCRLPHLSQSRTQTSPGCLCLAESQSQSPRCKVGFLASTMQAKHTNQGWKMKTEPIHRVQGTGSHLDFIIPWRSCCAYLIIWGCVDPVLSVGQQHQHLLGALRNADSGTPRLLRQNLHCTSSLGNWC